MDAADQRPIALLDLNFTLVADPGPGGFQSYAPAIDAETYHQELIDALAGWWVALVTVRDVRFQAATLASIARKCRGWQPDAAHFRDRSMTPPAWKQHVLRQLEAQGRLPAPRVLAIESNADTRAMYRRNGIEAVRREAFLARGEHGATPPQQSLFR